MRLLQSAVFEGLNAHVSLSKGHGEKKCTSRGRNSNIEENLRSAKDGRQFQY